MNPWAVWPAVTLPFRSDGSLSVGVGPLATDPLRQVRLNAAVTVACTTGVGVFTAGPTATRCRPTRGPRVTTTSSHAMALTAVDSLGLNASGIGIYPLSAKPFWPALMVLCRNAFTAVPTWGSGYFEQTISYVASTIG